MSIATRTELPTQLRASALEGIDAVRDAVVAAGRLAATVAAAAARWVRADAEWLRTYMDHHDVAPVRRQVPLGAILVGSAAVGVVSYLVLRRPVAGRPVRRYR
jgi:hypothetical protein